MTNAGWTVLALLAIGCAEDPGKGKVRAEVTDVVPEAPKPKAEAAPITYLPVDQARSSIGALAAKVTAQHAIAFPDFTGKVGMRDGEVASVALQVSMATLSADHPKLTEHLRTEDFFDVAKHPAAVFASTSIEEGSDVPGMTHTVTGDLLIHGTTKTVTVPARIVVEQDEVTARSEFVIDRRDFGLTYPGKKDDLIKDNVALTIEWLAPRG